MPSRPCRAGSGRETLVIEWVESGNVAYKELRGSADLRGVGAPLSIKGKFRVKSNTWG